MGTYKFDEQIEKVVIRQGRLRWFSRIILFFKRLFGIIWKKYSDQDIIDFFKIKNQKEYWAMISFLDNYDMLRKIHPHSIDPANNTINDLEKRLMDYEKALNDACKYIGYSINLYDFNHLRKMDSSWEPIQPKELMSFAIYANLILTAHPIEDDNLKRISNSDSELLVYLRYIAILKNLIKEKKKNPEKNRKQENEQTLKPSGKVFNELQWIEDKTEFTRHIKILKKNGIITTDINGINIGEKINITTKTPYVDVICLFEFWERNKYINSTHKRWIRIFNAFMENNKEFKKDQLRKQASDLKNEGSLLKQDGDKEHNRLKFFSEILKKN